MTPMALKQMEMFFAVVVVVVIIIVVVVGVMGCYCCSWAINVALAMIAARQPIW